MCLLSYTDRGAQLSTELPGEKGCGGAPLRCHRGSSAASVGEWREGVRAGTGLGTPQQPLLSTVSDDSFSFSKLLCLYPWVTWEAWPFEVPENVANCNSHSQLTSLRMTSNKLGLEIPKVRCQVCPLETLPVEEQPQSGIYGRKGCCKSFMQSGSVQ